LSFEHKHISGFYLMCYVAGASQKCSSIRMYNGRLVFGVDLAGLILICAVSFGALIPFVVAPVITYFQLDPTYVFFELTIPSIFMKNDIFVDVLLTTSRFITLLVVGSEAGRIISLGVVCGSSMIKSIAIFIEKLNYRAMIIRSQFLFLANFLNYTTVVINFSKANIFLGQITLVMISSCILIMVWSGYATVALRPTIPLPFYLILPLATLLEQLVCIQALPSAIKCYEQSRSLLRIWRYTVLQTRNRKFVIRKVEAMTPIRVNARAFSFDLFYCKRSTMGTFYTIVITHTVNAVLLVPAPNLS
jgi:hypothetical protein